ncbi:MAG: metal ABC transporter ATP-binding protein [Cyanobacteria bacterium]|nr:metal ABC transporter ATP-binding protein [Cyanobacteriota bacterium]MDW8199720.1 metal ABC transporter ATP-binding protein [Cyanobacteriota bacterium SKYGB_h_bin112]
MLEVFNLVVSCRGNCLLRGINFTIAPGQAVGVLGPNGAGKTTLLKAMLGLITPTHGQVLLDQRPLHRQRHRVAYMPQRSQIDWDYPVTVWTVALMARIAATGWFREPDQPSRELVKTALQRVEMWEFRHRQLAELSGGQQQRVFLARALAQQADVLLFDEPFTGVDKKTEAILFEVFQELKAAGKMLLVISHDLGETLLQYDRLLLLNKYLIASGTRHEVLTVSNIQQAYGSSVIVVGGAQL